MTQKQKFSILILIETEQTASKIIHKYQILGSNEETNLHQR